MKLLLVYPEVECSVTNTSTYSLPLGLGSIATYCRNKWEGPEELDIKILDGSIMSHKEQMIETQKYKPTVTGINSTIASQRNAYEIAKLAKDIGSFVFFGGVHSSATWNDGKSGMWKNMLKNRCFIDGIILYEGERAMSKILYHIHNFKKIKTKRDSCTHITNLAFAHRFEWKGKVDTSIGNPSNIHIAKMEELPDIDYSLFDLDRFFEQTQKKGFGKAVTYYAGKGCAKRGKFDFTYNSSSLGAHQEYLIKEADVCTFCGRNEPGLRNMKKEREARILKELHSKYGVTGFFNVQDTVNLQNETPIGLDDCWFRLFIGIESVTPKKIQKLKKRYGPNLIFQIGIESANPRMRKAYSKRTTNRNDLVRKIKLMEKEGIQLHASFILGGKGESTKSMQETTRLAKRLANYENVTWLLMSPQLILPGSPDYRALLQMPKMMKKWEYEDLIDIMDISKDFLRYFTPTLTREEIVEEIKQTFRDIRKKNSRIVLDVKGVVGEEEADIEASRPYVQ